MLRFLLLAIPLLVLTMAVFGMAQEMAGVRSPDETWGPGRELPLMVTVGGFVVESLALTALYLLARGRGPSWWLDGLLAGWLGWLFRGPVMVLGVASYGRFALAPWKDLALSWWVLYSICGFLLAWLARRLPKPGA